MFKQFDYRKYKAKPYYLPGDPNTDGQVIKRKQAIEKQLHKYKHYKDFDRVSSLVSYDARHLYHKYAALGFYSSFLFIPFLMHKYYRVHFDRKIFVLNVWKVFFTVGLITIISWKSDLVTRVFERNPYGTVSAPIMLHKRLSYNYDIFQDVNVIKQKYNDQSKSNYEEVLADYRNRRDPKLYKHYANYLRDFPEDCME